jgi:hypothetical protein
MQRTLRYLAVTAVVAGAALVHAGSAQALVSWQLYNFGTSAFDSNNNWSPIDYPSGIGHQPSPGNLGEGGEKYDIEGMFSSFTGGNLNLAVTSSFGQNVYSPTWNRFYGAGDLFLDLGRDGTYDYAIERSSGHLYSGAGVNNWLGITNTPGTYYSYTSIRNQVGAWRIDHSRSLVDHGSVANALTQYASLETSPMAGGSGETFIWEASVPVALLSGLGSNGLRMHQTLECGNDMAERDQQSPPVPEPGTLMLLGSGLLGSGFVTLRRRRA